LDLTLETQENAGATVLSGGSQLEPDDVIRIVTQYHVNVLTGDTSSMVRMAHHISTLPPAEREKIKLDKIIYTSEPLTPAQRAHIETVLPHVSICSVLGSAEAGPYAVTCQLSEQNALTENGDHTPAVNGTVNGVNGVNGVNTAYQDFVIDTRLVWIDILPKSVNEGDRIATSLPNGQEGLVALTSLSRLRNPLVRYMTGDVGSLHPLSPHSAPLVPEADRPHLCILRLRGRDSRFSFDWDGNYIEFRRVESLMNNPEYQILQWQIIREKMMPSLETRLEVRLLCAVDADRQRIEKMIKVFLHVNQENDHCFRLVFVNRLEDFERSSTGRKTMKFVDRV
jgi:phenylacetate-coenzyme A ligase PaaK-like adenylate-forming protein